MENHILRDVHLMVFHAFDIKIIPNLGVDRAVDQLNGLVASKENRRFDGNPIDMDFPFENWGISL